MKEQSGYAVIREDGYYLVEYETGGYFWSCGMSGPEGYAKLFGSPAEACLATGEPLGTHTIQFIDRSQQ